ncbi:hypothetical protein EYF80_068407 [Liparis tanakae]|uniref:Uncharacterized protein n=1 Tax=Liparis tanakae TaxID=230148 RepID=A0A4Z2DY37_9TELE|nr:hypothetical protein EYF80_068407 [Liparis tanakae]
MNLVSKASGVSSASDVRPPNSSWFSVSLTSRRRTISPRYMPLIIFSKLQEEDEHRKRQKHICESSGHIKVKMSQFLFLLETLSEIFIFCIKGQQKYLHNFLFVDEIVLKCASLNIQYSYKNDCI